MPFFGKAQQTNPFEGKTFRIDNYINDQFDNSEDLIFAGGKVEGSVCIQYGFEKAAYLAKENKKGSWEFSCTMISVEHGIMVWKGT